MHHFSDSQLTRVLVANEDRLPLLQLVFLPLCCGKTNLFTTLRPTAVHDPRRARPPAAQAGLEHKCLNHCDMVLQLFFFLLAG